MDVMAEYDEETDSLSTLSFVSQHKDGVFTSVTINTTVVPFPDCDPLPDQGWSIPHPTPFGRFAR